VGRVQRLLTFENVLVTMVAFLVLGGATAIAANQLGKNSVGRKQLKANSVTTAKIKKNAVSAAKIRAGAIDGTKVKDGSIGGTKVDMTTMPFSRIVHEARGASTVAVGSSTTPFPLENPTFVQAAGEDDLFSGAIEFGFPAGCEAPRSATATALVDAPDPTKPNQANVVAMGEATDEEGTGATTRRVGLGNLEIGGALFQANAATSHTIAIVVEGTCKSGSGITASHAALDVVGVR
jgi:hypothetical protein